MSRINYASWARVQLLVKNLKLDKDNPRIPSYIAARSQQTILLYLVEEEKVYQLAEKIVEKGFISHDPIYVIKENERYIVVEGNRRTSALKCLIEPSIIPSARLRSRFIKLKNKLNEEELKQLEKIEVYVSPSRQAAQNVLFELHAEGKLSWSKQQVNRFIATIDASSNETLEQIAERLKVPPSDIKDAVQEYYLEQYFIELGLPSDIEALALNPKKFPISTLTRLVNKPEFRKITGFKLDGNKLRTDCSKNLFNEFIKTFVIDLVNKKQNSRTLNKDEVITQYINETYNQISSLNSEGAALEFSPKTPTSIDESTKKPQKREKKVTEMLIPPSKTYNTGHEKLDSIIKEAQGMLLGNYKTASSLLLRTILELTVVKLFDLHGKKEVCLNTKNGRTKNLSDNIAALCHRPQWFKEPAYLDDLTRFTNKDSKSWVSLESINRYAHGDYSTPDNDVLRQIWLIIEPLVNWCCVKNFEKEK